MTPILSMPSTLPGQKEDRIVFAAGSKSFSVCDIVDAAHFRGEIDQPWDELRLRLESEKIAEEADAEIDDAAIDSAAVEFRYQYDLITAEETERWLELRNVTLGEFGDYFARDYWRKTFGHRARLTKIPYVEATDDLRELLAIDLILSGELDRMATKLAWRIAAREAGSRDEIDPAMPSTERAHFQERMGIEEAGTAEWLGKLRRDKEWLEDMLAMEGIYRGRCVRLLTPEAREREINALRLPLTRFDVEMIELESRDAASEAFLCVRDDGMSMAEVAQEGRYPFRRTELILEEVPDDLQQKFLSLSPGSVLEPTPRDDGFLLSRLIGKTEPRPDDPNVAARIEARILGRHFADLSANHIQWSIMPTE